MRTYFPKSAVLKSASSPPEKKNTDKSDSVGNKIDQKKDFPIWDFKDSGRHKTGDQITKNSTYPN